MHDILDNDLQKKKMWSISKVFALITVEYTIILKFNKI